MYGLINRAVRGLVTEQFGEEAWTKIRTRAGVEDDDFVSMSSYDDSVTYDLVAAATEELLAPLARRRGGAGPARGGEAEPVSAACDACRCLGRRAGHLDATARRGSRRQAGCCSDRSCPDRGHRSTRPRRSR